MYKNFLKPHEYNPFPEIKTHKFNPVFKDQISERENFEKFYGKEELVDSLFIADRTNELNSFLILLKEAFVKKERKIIIIKGPMGCGKSLFLRHGLYKFLTNDSNFHKSLFDTDKKKIVFCTFQTPTSRLKPYNAFYKIFRDMFNYLYLFYEEKINLKKLNSNTPENSMSNFNNGNDVNNSNRKAKKFSDEIINIILDEQCFYLIKYIELILKQDLIKLFEKKFKSNKNEINLNDNFTLENQRENTVTLNKSKN